jgi:predicted metalloprotease with PDZ domain
LIWLQVDTTIRKQSGGKKSIEDFLRVFCGGDSSAPMVKPYSFESLTEALNEIVPYDWKKFFDDRLYAVGSEHAPLGGIEAAGYLLEYSERMSDTQRTVESVSGGASVAYSLGLRMNAEGEVVDVLSQMPAAKAGIGPGMKVTAVNAHQYSPDVLRQAIRDAKRGGYIELLVQNGKRFTTYKLEYHGGERYPILTPNGQPKLLDDILKPLSR